MELYKALLTSVGAFLLIQTVLLPLMTRRWRADRTHNAVTKAAALAAVDFLRTLALMASVTYALVALVVVYVQQHSGVTVAEFATAIQKLEEFREVLGKIGTGWSMLFAVVLVTILIVFSYRRGKVTMEKEIERVYGEEMERLRVVREAGEWEDLPPNEQMQKLQEEYEKAAQLLQMIEQQEQPPGLMEQEQRRALQEHMEQVENAWHAVDWHRRMNLSWNPDVMKTGGKPSPWGRIKLFVVSKGFLTSLKGGKRILHRTALLMLFLSLISVQTGRLAEAADNKIVELEKLHIAASPEVAAETYQNVLASHDEAGDGELGSEDEEILDGLAREFETAVLSDPNWSPPLRASAAGARLLRSYRARDAVLRTVPRPAIGSGPKVPRQTMAMAEGLSDIERLALERYSAELNAKGPRTEIGRQARAQLRTEVASRPSLWNKMKVEYKAGIRSFQQPVGAREVSRLVVGEVLSHGMSGVPVPDSELGQFAAKMAKASGKASLKEIYDIKFQQYVTEIAEGRGLNSAVAKAGGRAGDLRIMTSTNAENIAQVLREMPSPERTASKLRAQPPGMAARNEPNVDFRRAEAASDRIRDIRSGGRSNAPATIATDAFVGYDDHFPGEIGSETRTTRGRILAKRLPAEYPVVRPTDAAGHMPPMSGSGTSSGRVRPRPVGRGMSAPMARSLRSASRARSFVRLRGFARIGGVLIGREPDVDTDHPPDLIDIDWRPVGDDLSLSLTRRGGERFDLGTFDPGRIHAALLYAADGRPTAVTMVTADPLIDLRILLHPTLLDTPIGCEIIELDRFVDIHTGSAYGATPRSEATEFVLNAQALYDLAWATRTGLLWSQIEAAIEGRSTFIPTWEMEQHIAGLGEGTLEGTAVAMRRIDGNAALVEQATTAFMELDGVLDKARTPLRAKPEFYDQALVEAIERCGRDAANLDACLECIAEHAEMVLHELRTVAWDGWLYAPPEFDIWSGVRELDYTVDGSLMCFSDAGRPADSLLWPFRFMVQVAFTSPAYFADRNAGIEDYVDESPWEFPTLQDYVTQTLATVIPESSVETRILKDAAEFTLLQRLFRCGFDGRLGSDFPMERLVTLAEVAAEHQAASVRTPRWNPKPGVLEELLGLQLLALLGRTLEAEYDQGTSEARLTRQLAEIGSMAAVLENPSQAAAMSSAAWNSHFNVDSSLAAATRACERAVDAGSETDCASCIVAAMYELIEITTESRAMREALGVWEEEYQVGCLGF